MPVPFDLQTIKTRAMEEIVELMASQQGITPLLFRKGDYLIREGEKSRNIYIILKGTCVVEQESYILAQPAVKLAEIHCEADDLSLVGEMAYLGDQARTASVRALEDTHTLCVKPQHVDVIIQSAPMLTRVIFQQFVLRLKEANQMIKELNTLTSL